MKSLQISSIPMMELVQKACEVLVVDNLINLPHTYNTADRKLLLLENQQAHELINHLRDMIAESKKDT